MSKGSCVSLLRSASLFALFCLPESLKIFRFLLDFWESWRLSRVRNGVGI